MARDPKQQFNVYLPPDLVRRIKYASIDARLSLSAYVERALRNQLERDTQEPEAHP
ncbi:CopG family transcriptional regulator [Deinococcus maricopensis]|uniref:CopG domain protein DNA-binding domain protein n=1 Tax=Deinococcus maricopensis (strain DSM 21211 / LMG 22137 / NRRL B-23946 / LB-34) TaxID=709986 RepID=E8U8E9_DEIML|nr:CopG family transcriptional regulator [Deinococcus maricopensis]ADV67338.1 CopG domain protein DNA-binding domain protein [Deinococcus maricopensis DSM 21211]